MKFIPDSKEEKRELLFGSLLFIFLWTYLIIRANTVFYIHDEIVTKWIYMVNWNPFPYQGYVDANNHFMNSLFGGLFIRLFQSDAMWIVRLPSLLAFPLYFWSLFGMRHFFAQKINFYLLLFTLTCSAFIIEYFGLARGYGISMGFLACALLQTLKCFSTGDFKYLIGALFAWVFAVYANLTLIPFALAGLGYLALFPKKDNRLKWMAALGLAILPLAYAVKYSFHLKDIGKLYLGGQEGIIDTTIHSLTPYLWNIENSLLDIGLIAISLFLLFTVAWSYYKSKNMFDQKMVFSLFLLLGVGNILGQNWLLGINYPQDRAALYLVIFFLGGLCFTLDYWKNKWLAYPLIVSTLLLFVYHMNLQKSIFFYYEHFDEELLTKIPVEVKGIPPSTGGHFWRMDNELTRTNKLQLNILQAASRPSDTLQDYIVSTADNRPDILNLYHPIHGDSISGLILFERNHFLSREKIGEYSLIIDGSSEYSKIYAEGLDQPLFLRCSGVLQEVTIFNKLLLIFEVKDTVNKEIALYQTVHLIENCAIQDNGELNFDFTFTVNHEADASRLKFYLWNLKKADVKGEIKLEVYKIL